jgi:phosphoribosylformylglycinamidine (FGAM) synthase PurS component
MWALIEDNQITKVIHHPQQIKINDTVYPAKIFTLWSNQERKNLGIYSVTVDNSNYKNPDYYNNGLQSFNFANDEVVRVWAEATPKSLDDKLYTQIHADENRIPSDKSIGDVMEIGIKNKKKNEVKKIASRLLGNTDWYVVKANEVEDYNVPENITTYRADVRAKSNEMETIIDNCDNVDEIESLYIYSNTGTEDNPVMTRPLGEFPVL